MEEEQVRLVILQNTEDVIVITIRISYCNLDGEYGRDHHVFKLRYYLSPD